MISASGLRAVALASSILLAGLPGVARAQAGAEWTSPAGSPEGTRYSTLTEITAANVGTLVQDFSYQTGLKASHEGQPLVVGSTLYLVTPYPNNLVALDLANGGKVLWTFMPNPNTYARGVSCCDIINRGATYDKGVLFYNLLDASTVAVNAKTGKQIWRTSLGDPTTGETMTGAPIVVNGKVIVGNSGGEFGVRGWIQALDAKTGAVIWKAYNTGPDADVLIGTSFKPFYPKDKGTNLGETSWPHTLWQQGGATSWGWLTYDPGLNILYHGTSNPGVWNPDMRPGDNKWAATIFARNPDTGQALWADQLTPHDGWDFDAVNESIVADLKFPTATAKVIVQFNKNGFAYTIDRVTGHILVAKPFGNVTWATGVDVKTSLPAVVSSKRTHQGVLTTGICPTPLGVKDWQPSAFSPATNLFYVPTANLCDSYEALKALYIAGTPFQGSDLGIMAGPGGNMGALVAWNAVTGSAAWTVKEPLPVYSGVLATAGGIVFYGTLDKHFKAVNATTGDVLFNTTLECGVVSAPISFTAPDGHQRIAIMTGVGWLPGGFAGGPCPAGTNFGDASTGLGHAIAALHMPAAAGPPTTAPTSGVLHVFKLP
jgi:alcohol dehydrogenase (cytochrome c)